MEKTREQRAHYRRYEVGIEIEIEENIDCESAPQSEPTK